VDYRVILSPVSLKNLAEITAWMAQDDPVLAEKFGNELLDRIAILQQFPKVGSIYLSNRKWRKLVSRPYVIIYRLKPRLRIVEVMTFRHAARRPLEK
jgi:toxin ParE1/3/4